MAGYPHPRNLIRENLDLTAIREIYMPRKFPGIRYNIVYASMIGFNLSLGQLFSYLNYYKGGQVTKLIILVKICYKLLYVIQGVENSLVK